MKIYIDNDYKCHTFNDGTMREFDVSFFNGKSKEFVEGYRYVPDGETWVREDGEVFAGKMISPWRDYLILEEFQNIYERINREYILIKREEDTDGDIGIEEQRMDLREDS